VNVGIIVYPRTGHTLSVAKKLQDKLSAAGHTVNLEQVETAGAVSPNATSVELRTRPAVDGYEALVFGCPVWGGVPALPMTSYLKHVGSLQGKKVACLVTGAFPAGAGRNQTLARLGEICEAKGATLCGSGSVGWMSLDRGRQIAKAVDELSARF